MAEQSRAEPSRAEASRAELAMGILLIIIETANAGAGTHQGAIFCPAETPGGDIGALFLQRRPPPPLPGALSIFNKKLVLRPAGQLY